MDTARAGRARGSPSQDRDFERSIDGGLSTTHRSSEEFNGWLDRAGRRRGFRPARQGGVRPDDPAARGADRLDREPLSERRDRRDRRRRSSPRTASERFDDAGEVDFAYSIPHVGRFRVNVFRQRGSISMVLRKLRFGGPSFEEIGLPDAVRTIADEHRGLILVTGPTGSGKTTTLAAMIDYINKTKPVHIVTIEDPIEVLHQDEVAVDQPARGRQRHPGLPGRAARRAAPGPRRDPDRRDARHRDRARRDPGGRDRPPRDVHAAHRGRHRDREPRDRLLPALSAEAGAAGARRHAARHHLPAPGAHGRRRAHAGLEILVNTGRIAERIADPDKTYEIKDVIAGRRRSTAWSRSTSRS